MSKDKDVASQANQPKPPFQPRYRQGDLVWMGSVRCIVHCVLRGEERDRPTVRYFVTPADQQVVFPLTNGQWTHESELRPVERAAGVTPDTTRDA